MKDGSLRLGRMEATIISRCESESRDMATFAISCLVLVMPYQLEVPEVEAQESKGAASVNQ